MSFENVFLCLHVRLICALNYYLLPPHTLILNDLISVMTHVSSLPVLCSPLLRLSIFSSVEFVRYIMGNQTTPCADVHNSITLFLRAALQHLVGTAVLRVD